MLAASTYTLGQIRKSAQPDPRPELEQQDAPDREPPPDERREERPSQAGAEGREEQADLAARQPCPITTIANSTPGPMKLAARRGSERCAGTRVPRGSETPRRGASAAASGRRSRSSWNGVRIASSATAENTYEHAWTRNGSARAIPNSAPPSAGLQR